MKKIKHIMLCLVAFVAMGISYANAQDVGEKFKVDGLYYRSTSTSPLEVKVVAQNDYYWSDDSEKPTGEINIPAKVTYEGKTFTVTSIGNYAFSGCKSLTSVTIPDGVTSIGKWAFDDCTGLTSVTIPAGVTTIGEGAFSECEKLTAINVDRANTVYSSKEGVLFNKAQTELILFPYGKSGSYVIPATVTSIGDEAFVGCNSLTSVTIPDGVTSIGERAFVLCNGLTSIRIPDGVSSIGRMAFAGCLKLNSIDVDKANTVYSSNEGVLFNKAQTELIQVPAGKRGNYLIPASVTTIGAVAFGLCTSLTSVTIPATVTSIGEGAFVNCESLTSVTIPATVTSIGEEAFYECNKLTSIDVDKANTVYGSNEGVLFNKAQTELIQFPYGKSGSYVIPTTVTAIGKEAFAECKSLTSVTISAGVTTIGDYAFAWCTGLTSITLPAGVTSIGDDAFYDCDGLREIISLIDNVEALNFKDKTNVFSYDITEDCRLKVPADKLEYYKNNEPWSRFANIIEIGESDIHIGTKFKIKELYYRITSVSPLEVAVVKRNSYTVHPSSSVIIPEQVTYEGKSFAVTAIGEEAFRSRSDYISISIPATVTSIGDYAFAECYNLKEIISHIENVSATTMGEDVFMDMNKNTCTLKVPAGKVNDYKNTPQWNEFVKIVENTTGVAYNVITNPIAVVAHDIIISQVAGQRVRLYDVAGHQLYSLLASADKAVLNVPKSGVYILYINGDSVKVMVK